MTYKTNTDRAVHALGNGRLLVYGVGADIINVYGPPYSSTSLLNGQWTFADGSSPIYSSQREKGTSVWRHSFLKNGGCAGTSEEFVATDVPAYLTKVDFQLDTNFNIKLPKEIILMDNQDSLMLVAPDTARIFIYPSGEKAYLTITCWGEGWKGIEEQPDSISLKFARGTSYMAIVGGSSYPDVVVNTGQAFQLSYAQHIQKVYDVDDGVVKRLVKTGSSKNGTLPRRENDSVQIHELCENIAFMIKAQQSEDGGIMAGHQYPLAYIRDQYGTCRGLVALGLFEEARRNLEFRFNKWKF
ncbi:MAG TPA: hypothetical protein VGE40_09945, partial [Bacilli bacterium]